MQRDAALVNGFPISISCTNASINPSVIAPLVDAQSPATPLTEANLIAHNQQMGNAEHTSKVSVATWIDTGNGCQGQPNNPANFRLDQWLNNQDDRLGYWMSHGGK
ncbi:hypothetical protein LTR22_012358 [Elasticomyces elasticus]|nr:hypothetical protein LTR22_012358 [Elasticomyces elasticus]KAK4903871.1 hypothetical protein LTR49_026574 [Elasticomyces elasticus]KAK5738207.1 hypothetical protein LTS12_025672 [Elasticomyces elasticus]